jgi:hypothetical protein
MTDAEKLSLFAGKVGLKFSPAVIANFLWPVSRRRRELMEWFQHWWYLIYDPNVICDSFANHMWFLVNVLLYIMHGNNMATVRDFLELSV